MIDMHVHLRDFEESHKETIAHGLSVASKIGYSALFEMPNTVPPLTSRREVERRIAFADQVLFEEPMPVFHGLYCGLTADAGQIAEMVQCVRDLFPRAVGLKLFAGPSTGLLEVSDAAQQELVYGELARLKYSGVLMVHCEEKQLFRDDPGLTHGQRRPLEAELASVRQQLKLAKQTGFSGTLHICHVTSAEVLGIIEEVREELPCRVSAGVTPHHLLLNEEQVNREGGYLYIVNPPLRSEEVRQSLFDAVLAGRADVLESDHAPHELSDKRGGAGGLPGIPGMLCAAAYLLKHGMDGSLLTRMVFEHPLDILQMDPEMLLRSAREEDQKLTSVYRITDMFDMITTGGWHSLCEKYRELAHAYPWDPYQELAKDQLS